MDPYFGVLGAMHVVPLISMPDILSSIWNTNTLFEAVSFV